MSGKILRLRQAKIVRNATSHSKGRRGNDAYRVREHLTEAETDKLLAALKRNRHGHRDWLIGLVIYRHGLRVSEACDLRWDDIDLPKRTIIVRRLKASTDSVHYLERDEVNGLKLLHRQQQSNGIKAGLSATRPDTLWRPGEWTHGGSSTSSGMPRSRIPCAIRPCRRSHSRISGGEGNPAVGRPFGSAAA